MSIGKKILAVFDTQVKPDVPVDHLSHIGQYIVDKRPDVIVHLGDHWDMPSLSSYDKGTKKFEGRRIQADIDAGNHGIDLLLGPLKRLQESQAKNKKKMYNPRLVFTMGNHCHRISRAIDLSPELEGLLGYDKLNLTDWEVHPFLSPVEIEGINFVHYLANPFSGKPYGGSALNVLKNVGKSFVCGHKQTLDICMRPTLNRGMQLGIICGACYQHDEDYKGPQGNTHFRGVVMLHEAKDGFALPMPVSLDFLKERYK